MAISKNQFKKYAKSRENPQLTEALKEKTYSHHRIFDDPGSKEKTHNQDLDLHSKTSENIIYEISPNEIENWSFHDRPESELGDIKSLAMDFLNIGQQQPCIVRPKENNKYELIVGERRWRAALLENLNLKVIIKNLSDNEAALAQATENDNRKDLSDYAKGMSFSRLIEKGIIKQKDLIERLGKTKQYVSALLSFSEIPPEITSAIGDMTNISARLAEKIKQLSKKGSDQKETLILLSDKLREGKIGLNRLNEIVMKTDKLKRPEKDPLNNAQQRIESQNGRHIFTWRLDNNKQPSIHFPKSISKFINSEQINIEDLNNQIVDFIEKKLREVK